jgi:hypothetical protein
MRALVALVFDVRCTADDRPAARSEERARSESEEPGAAVLVLATVRLERSSPPPLAPGPCPSWVQRPRPGARGRRGRGGDVCHCQGLCAPGSGLREVQLAGPLPLPRTGTGCRRLLPAGGCLRPRVLCSRPIGHRPWPPSRSSKYMPRHGALRPSFVLCPLAKRFQTGESFKAPLTPRPAPKRAPKPPGVIAFELSRVLCSPWQVYRSFKRPGLLCAIAHLCSRL